MVIILGLVLVILFFIIGLIGFYVKFILGKEFFFWVYGLIIIFFMGGI